MTEATHDWWAELRHGGMLVAPQILGELFPESVEIEERSYERLRSAWLRFEAAGRGGDGRAATRAFGDEVLEHFLGHAGGWQKAGSVSGDFKATAVSGERLRPDRVLTGGADGARLAVWFDESKRIGVGRGRRAHAQAVELLRHTGIPLGLLTNGRELRLLHAGPDYDAWAEWNAGSWFDEGEGRETLQGLLTVLGSQETATAAGEEDLPAIDRLTAAVRASRDRQGDLAQVLGEQVRRAVELLLTSLDHALEADPDLRASLWTDSETGEEATDDQIHNALYQAATRIIMRLVLILYAEARDLLPASLEAYHDSYGVEGLYRLLSEAERDGSEELLERRGAWPRLVSLFRLIHAGSPHPELAILAYGGALFRPGDTDEADPVSRAVAALESSSPSDKVVYDILRLLMVGKVRVRSGRGARWVAGPVDFSDLRTEYIGIIYEGLLDYELRRADPDDPIVILSVGRNPALPLSRLQAMEGPALRELLKKFKEEAIGPADDEEGGESEEDRAESVGEEAAIAEEVAEDDDAAEPETTAVDTRAAVIEWARDAVVASGRLRRPRGRNPDVVAFERRRQAEAEKLIDSVIPGGRLYLVASGNLRKGSGSFYTRPALAVPLAHRALEPLCYERQEDRLVPHRPEEILALKVCEPAMGSGSFLVAALRYLTEALARSLHHHGRIRPHAEGEAIVALPLGEPARADEEEEVLPLPPDDDRFDEMLRSRLKRHVVERCLYGVDLNPMAVELARLALWVETLDKELAFEFLDHKLKVGNSLVGCWLHLVQDYPVLALDREAGDGRTGELSQRLKKRLREAKAQLPEVIAAAGGARSLLDPDEVSAVDLVGPIRARFVELHEMRREDRERSYAELRGSDEFVALKQAMDAWCALWFWPAAGDVPLPTDWTEISGETLEVVERLVYERAFFHWELEFPDAFPEDRPGFDVVLGNPPWDIAKPNSQEFFSRIDPLYRTYSKTEAKRVQRNLFGEIPGLEASWIAEQGFFKAMGNFVKRSADPFNVSLGRARAAQHAREQWEDQRAERSGLAHRDHPYRHQGSADLNTYKLFLEVAHHLLRNDGRLGMLVPSGIYTDKGTTELRELFLGGCRWEWLYGFENRRKIFPIHSSFKFNPIVVERGGSTETLRAAFMRHQVEEWERPAEHTIELAVEDVKRFSPNTLSFMELGGNRDLDLVERIYSDHPLLGAVVGGAGAVYSREFDMTNDSRLFVTRSKLEGEGLIESDEDTRDPRLRARLWEAGYAPLYEGKSFWFHDPYFLGRGGEDSVSKFVAQTTLENELESDAWTKARLCVRNIGRSTDRRTLIAGLIPPAAHGNSCPTLDGLETVRALRLNAVLTSLVVDYIVRMKVSANLNWFYLETLPVPNATDEEGFAEVAENLVWALNAIGADFDERSAEPLVDPKERLAARLSLDALTAALYGLTVDDMSHIAARFPIYDGEVPEEHRYPCLAVRTYGAMVEGGIEAAQTRATELAKARDDEGLSFGLDEIWAPEGGWERANAEADALHAEASAA